VAETKIKCAMKVLKSSIRKILLLFVGVVLSAGCQYDDTEIQEKYADLEKRIKALETLCDGFNKDIK